MSDDIFNEGREFNVRSIILTVLFIGLIVVLGLYFTGHLPGFSPSDEENSGGQQGSVPHGGGSGITEEPVNESEKQELEQATKKVVLIKYSVFKTDDGTVVGVTGYLGVKVKYYDNILRDLIISVQNVPIKDIRVSKEVYREDYKGYVVVYFKIIPLKEGVISGDKLDLLVMYLNVPSKFEVDLSKNVRTVESDFKVEFQYSVPGVTINPVNIPVTFNVFSKYQSKVKSVINDIIMHYQETNIVMKGDEQYYMQAVDYDVGTNSVTITYRSTPNVQSGVYQLVYNYYLPSGSGSKVLGKVLVKNTAKVPPFLDFSVMSDGDKVVLSKKLSGYELMLKVENYQARMSLPVFRVRVYDSRLELVSEVNLDSTVLRFGENIINVQVPESIVENKGVYYIVVRLMTPDETMYSVVLDMDTNKVVIPESENMNLGDVKFMLYPTQYYTTFGDMIYDFGTSENLVSIKAPLVVMYPSNEDSISVKVSDMFGNSRSVQLGRVATYRVSATEVVPIYAGLFDVENVPLVQNYIITVEFPDGYSVKGSINLVNIYYNGGYLNSLMNEEVVKGVDYSEYYYNCDEVYAYYIIADSKGVDTPLTLSDALNSILGTKVLISPDDVQFGGDKVVIKVSDGIARKLMDNTWVSYLPVVQSSVSNIRVLIGQNENPVLKTSVPASASFESGEIVVDLPFLDEQKYVYLLVNNYVIPLNWFRDKPDIQSSGFDYSIYTYLDPKLGVESDSDLSNLYMSAYNDNPLAGTILSTKLGYLSQFTSLVQALENEEYENEPPMNETNSTASSIVFVGNSTTEDEMSMVFYVGLDEPAQSASLIVNGVSVPVSVESVPQVDYYLVQVKVPQTQFYEALDGVSISDIVSGKRIIELRVGGKVFYNLLPFNIGLENFLVSGNQLIVMMFTSGDTSLIKCDGVPLDIVYDVTKKGQEGVVYYIDFGCKLTVQSDLFGEIKLFP